MSVCPCQPFSIFRGEPHHIRELLLCQALDGFCTGSGDRMHEGLVVLPDRRQGPNQIGPCFRSKRFRKETAGEAASRSGELRKNKGFCMRTDAFCMRNVRFSHSSCERNACSGFADTRTREANTLTAEVYREGFDSKNVYMQHRNKHLCS